MADNNNNDDNEVKKSFPGSFFLLLLAAIMLVLAVQSFIEIKRANVSFSYQVEHLVNLKLIDTERSSKTAQNEKLVTFSGLFRTEQSEDAKKRYKYLELLDQKYAFAMEKESLLEEMKVQKEKIYEAADWYLHLIGMAIPDRGYRVIGDAYDTPGRENRVIVSSLSDKEIESLGSIERGLSFVEGASSNEELKPVESSIEAFLKNMQSPFLGIGDESIKKSVKEQLASFLETKESNVEPAEKLVAYQTTVATLKGILYDLGKDSNFQRLGKLRSVRNYVNAVEDYNLLVIQQEENALQFDKARKAVENVIWYFNSQELSTRALEKADPEVYAQWFAKAKDEWEGFEENKGMSFKAPDQPLNAVLEKTFKSREPTPNYFSYLVTILPVLLVVLVLYFVFSRQMKGMGSNAMNFGKSPARLLSKDKNKVTFKDVAGIDEAEEELTEIVDFLKAPDSFTALGGRIPKGVLCVGPPGTGKTLIAKAVAGEADRPFFSISGSDFVEMFVGVGASRIRDMFTQAKKQAPCIIFIDEIDAVGRHRGAGIGGGHDEREQTLNQLLVEMDGFDSNEGVILMAATNRPDVLDKALLRPGRFDRRIIVALPDVNGRLEILKVHARKVKLDTDVNLDVVARSTPGSSGADLENILNEAALLAARRKRTAITNQDVSDARDKVLFGKERRSMELDEEEKLTTAYHESGHAIVGLIVKHADPVEKVTIIPRGMSLGSTMFLPKKNKLSYWKKEIIDRLAVLMGGRAAEEIFVHDVSSGAQQDIKQATQLARSMVCEWGMSDRLGAVAYNEASDSGQYGIGGHYEKKYSEVTAEAIDQEVREIIDEAYDYAKKVCVDNREKLELMTQMLMEFETLDSEDIQKIIKGEWDIEEKRERLKKAKELHQKSSPPPVSGVEEGKNEDKAPTTGGEEPHPAAT